MISVVVFCTPLAQWEKFLRQLATYVVDYPHHFILNVANNHREHALEWSRAVLEIVGAVGLPANLTVKLQNHYQNLGYGRANNIAVATTPSDHLFVCNTDLEFASRLLPPLTDNIVIPCFRNATEKTTLTRRYPSVWHFLLRAINSRRRNQINSLQLAEYEMRDFTVPSKAIFNVPIFSGCCFLVPTEKFAAIGGFWPHFFLYFEDFDLSLRFLATENFVNPDWVVVHRGGHTANKRWPHLVAFGQSMMRFYYRHGVKWF